MIAGDWVIPGGDKKCCPTVAEFDDLKKETLCALNDLNIIVVDPTNPYNGLLAILAHFRQIREDFCDTVNDERCVSPYLSEFNVFVSHILARHGLRQFLHRILVDDLERQHAQLLDLLASTCLSLNFEYFVMKAFSLKIKRKLVDNRLDDLLQWVQTTLHPLLAQLFIKSEHLYRTTELLELMTLKAFIRERASNLFNIIAGFQSAEVVVLAQALAHPYGKAEIRSFIWPTLKDHLDASLLHVGKSTRAILAHLCQAFPTLVKLDSSSWLLEQYLKTVREYVVSKRPDYPEAVLHQIEALAQGSMRQKFLDPDTKCKYDVPDLDPRNFDSCILADVRASTKTGNPLCILANFFDSSEAFIKAYKKLMIDHRLKNDDGVEELVARVLVFEGSEWKECMVIIRDFCLSEQFNASLHKPPFYTMLVSHLFWPDIENDAFFLPTEALRLSQAKQEEAFMHWKPDRTLEWTNAVGTVELDVEFDNGENIPFTCSNDEASILILLLEMKGASLDELQAVANLSKERIKKAIGFWLTKGVIGKKNAKKFAVNATFAADYERPIDFEISMWEDVGGKDLGVTKPKVKEIFSKVFPLITGMIRNMGPLPLGKIHSSLGMFSAEYREREEDLSSFLDTKVSEHTLQISPEGLYSIPN